MFDNTCYIGAMCFVLLFVIFALQCGTLSGEYPVNFATQTEIVLFNNDYVKLVVGNPGVEMNFKVNYTLNDIQIHTSLDTTSQTFDMIDSEFGYEWIYIGKYAFRMPVSFVSFDPEPFSLLYESSTYDGTLGLGKQSPIWRYWRNVTISPRKLIFGKYDYFTQMDYTQRPTPLNMITRDDIYEMDESDASSNLCSYFGSVKTSNEKYFIVFDIDNTNTLLPKTIFNKLTQRDGYATVLLESSDCVRKYKRLNIEDNGRCEKVTTLGLKENNITLSNKKEYSYFEKSHNGTYISLGRRALDDYSMYVDWDTNLVLMSQSVFGFTEPSENAVFSLLILSIVVTWLLIIANGVLEKEWIFIMVLLLEFFFYFASGITLVVDIFGFRWYRYISNFTNQNPQIVLVFVCYIFLTSAMIFAVLVFQNVKFPLYLDSAEDRHRNNLSNMKRKRELRMVLFLGNTMAILWVCVLPYQQTVVDLIYIAIFSMSFCIASSVITFYSLLRDKDNAQFMMWQLLIYYMFLYFFSLVPSVHITTIDFVNPSHEFEVYMYSLLILLTFVFYPSVCIFALTETSILKKNKM